jgi:hypothetical protein
MSEAGEKRKIDTSLPKGKPFGFMPIPVDERHVEWFDAGPVSFAVETRVLGEAVGGMVAGGGSIHLFSGDRARELVRFDCFDSEPHYHYLNHREHVNTVWGFDSGVNGPMPDWVLWAVRHNLPGMLRSAGEQELAARVEAEGFDVSVLTRVGEAVAEAQNRCAADDAGLVEEGVDWVQQWREKNPDVAFGTE